MESAAVVLVGAGMITLAIPLLFFGVLQPVERGAFVQGLRAYTMSWCWCSVAATALSDDSRAAARHVIRDISEKLQASKELAQRDGDAATKNTELEVRGIASGFLMFALLTAAAAGFWLASGRSFAFDRVLEHALLSAAVFVVVELTCVTALLLRASTDAFAIDRKVIEDLLTN